MWPISQKDRRLFQNLLERKLNIKSEASFDNNRAPSQWDLLEDQTSGRCKAGGAFNIQVPAEKFSKYVTSLYFEQPLPEPNTRSDLFSLFTRFL